MRCIGVAWRRLCVPRSRLSPVGLQAALSHTNAIITCDLAAHAPFSYHWPRPGHRSEHLPTTLALTTDLSLSLAEFLLHFANSKYKPFTVFSGLFLFIICTSLTNIFIKRLKTLRPMTVSVEDALANDETNLKIK